MSEFRKPVLPICADCGHTRCAPVRKAGVAKNNTGGLGEFDWLCGDCLYRRQNPDALPAVALPRERNVPLQTEKLFEL